MIPELIKAMEDAPPYLTLVVMVWGVLELRYTRKTFTDHITFYHTDRRDKPRNGKSQ